MSKQPQAHRIAGDHSDPEPPGCWSVFVFGVLCVLVGICAMWVWLRLVGLL